MGALTLEQFIERLPALAQAFVAETRRQAETDDTFSRSRTPDDWCREMAAWIELGMAADALALAARRVQ